MSRCCVMVAGAGLAAGLGGAAIAQVEFEPPFQGYSWELFHDYSGSGGGAVDMATLPDGDYLVALNHGVVSVLGRDGQRGPDLLGLEAEVSTVGDGGLTSVALHPSFPDPAYLYLLYSEDPNPSSPESTLVRQGVLVRYTLDGGANFRAVVPGSRTVLIGEEYGEGILLEGFFHNNSHLAWGSDGTLLVLAGSGSPFYRLGAAGGASYFGPDGFPESWDLGDLRSQTLDNYNGKLLRIDPLTGAGLPSNPHFTGNPGEIQSKVFARGLRMPWKMDVDRGSGSPFPEAGLPGRVWIGDVGLDTYEEVTATAPRGGDNFGWPFWEGTISPVGEGNYSGSVPFPDFGETTAPLLAIGHSGLDFDAFPNTPAVVAGLYRAQSMTAGVFYTYRRERTDGMPAPPYSEILDDLFFYADWSNRGLFWVRQDELGRVEDVLRCARGALGTSDNPVAMEVDPLTGEVFLMTFAGPSKVWRLRFDAGQAGPIPRLTGTPLAGALPLAITFDASASSHPGGRDLVSYNWDFGDGTTLSDAGPMVTHVYTEAGTFRAMVTVADDAGTANSTRLRVDPGNEPPQVTIVSPGPGARVPAGTDALELAVSGEALDADGPVEVLWRLRLQEGRRIHLLDEAHSTSATLTSRLSDDGDARYLVEFLAIDEAGVTAKATRELLPVGAVVGGGWVAR